MTATYGPWVAVNPGDAVPDGRGQVQCDNETREDAMGDGDYDFQSFSGEWYRVTDYRRLIEPVRGEVVAYWDGDVFSSIRLCDAHRLIIPTRNGALIPGEYPGPDGAVIRVEVIDPTTHTGGRNG